ncbi:hypothetical protein [Flavobacterium sp. Root420]|uniref:hypothetical protein n=1 Tax=Flavobacterium sp. Root420 TaxID=1736533 RepID=UPI000A6381B9|nr:hypothetical protein [Flavobacterium sp. Root420]
MTTTITKLTEVRYYLYAIIMKPYADKAKEYSSSKIVKEVANHLANLRSQGKAVLVDRNERKQGFSPRELFLSSAVLLPAERRIRCTMALIRKGKNPMFMKKGTFALEELKQMGDIVEITHFFIDYKTDQNVVCVERNPHGPNIADIEYYFKKIARDELQLAKFTELNVFMDNSIENTLGAMKNVLSFNIKLKSANLELIDKQLEKNYFKGFNLITNLYKPEFLRIEAFFKKQGKKVNLPTENKIATGMFAKALEVFKANPEETDYYDNFVVVYEDGKGVEETFNLLKDKKFFERKIEEGKDLKQGESYDLIKDDLTLFVNSL